ncbi:MAG TPA: CHAT domain-containing protein [Candidatus Polarisedimenticolaceae bacterium]
MANRETQPPPFPPALRALRRAVASGTLAQAREVLGGLSDQDRAALHAAFGDAGMRRLDQLSLRRARAVKRGKVVVLHGTMGCHLATVDASDDKDRIWLNLWRLLWGRMKELELDADGHPVPKKIQVRTDGQLEMVYLPMLLQLDENWDVKPFCYDWRWDVDAAADALAAEIRNWGKGEPVHVVAHSMGGLVTRSLMVRQPDLWRSMDDPDGRKKGGRLVMLGTPNRGSYNAPLALSGDHGMVKLISALDLPHSKKQELRVFNSFLGTYQLLPAPYVDIDDDHAKLYTAAAWGSAPVRPAHLDHAAAFHGRLREVRSPERMTYVAGYGEKTNFRIRVPSPGKFELLQTRNGDGTVPHELGRLPGVPMFFVRDAHMNLCKNDAVLDAIDDLLLEGTTGRLDAVAPPTVRGKEEEIWIEAARAGEIPAEVADRLNAVKTAASRRTRGRRAGDPLVEQARLESEVLRTLFGGEALPMARRRARGARVPRIAVEVRCDDISNVDADVYAVGHYIGVPPQRAELAVDRMVSGTRETAKLVLTSLTRRGELVGALGDVQFYPIAGNPRRVAAIAGMGHAGTFGAGSLRTLARRLSVVVSSLPRRGTLCTVLIGSGEGCLAPKIAVRSMLLGLADAVNAGAVGEGAVRRVVFAEQDVEKSEQILVALRAAAQDPEIAQAVRLLVGPRVIRGDGKRIGKPLVDRWIHGAALQASAPSAPARARRALKQLLGEVRERELTRLASAAEVSAVLAEAARESEKAPTDADAAQAPVTVPTRLSVFVADGKIVVAAITNTTTVAERVVGIDPALVSEAIERMVRPPAEEVAGLGDTLARLVLPRDFRDLVADVDRPIIFEVDRNMAPGHWEMLCLEVDAVAASGCVGLRRPVARQLRTTFSPPPRREPESGARLRALVVGDPGDPERSEDLPGARVEAREVSDLLGSCGVEVELLIGAPSNGGGPIAGIPPARRLDVLRKLMTGGFDILHYCGHGDFDARNPSRVGWVFKGGLLAAGELERVDRAPRLVVANACLSGRTSSVASGGRQIRTRSEEAALLPSLADAFFARGVRDYVGTAWEVDDQGAILFAGAFYRALLRDGASVGDAVLAGRRALAIQPRYGSLWAAYQHYGDPTLVMR